MTVAELIATLQSLDQSAPVYVRGYENGVNDIHEIREVQIKRDQHTEWYYGQHEVLYEAEAEGQFGYEIIGVNLSALD